MAPIYDFKGEVALVTGASSGMGLATAKAFAEAGAAVVLVDINEDALGIATEELTSAGQEAIGIACDVADEAQVAAMVERMIGLTKSAAMDYAPLGIRINAVCPGLIDTPMASDMIEHQPEAMKEFMRDQPIGRAGRAGRADEIAAAAIWLCSPGASFVLGVALPVDGGFVAH